MELLLYMQLKHPYGVKYSPSFGYIPTVKILLQVQSVEGLEPYLFLFDTGADITSLPVSATLKLGINLHKCPKELMVGYDGTPVSVYRSKIKVKFNQSIISIPCVFNQNEEVPIILGKAGILDKFSIYLDGKNQQITFEEF